MTLAGDGYLARLLRGGPVVFEGAQGVLLDEWRGFHPYTTWSTTTFENAEALLAEAGATATRLGVTRTYQTRHGPGPFPTEDPRCACRSSTTRTAAGRARSAPATWTRSRCATRCEVAGGVDAVALTHLRHRCRLPLDGSCTRR